MVKCADCGFLTLRNLFNGQLDEVDSDFRSTGNPPRRSTGVSSMQQTLHEYSQTPYRHVPICFARVQNLQSELRALPKDYHDYPATMVWEVISKERLCPDGYTEWQQGFTPKEHREMLDKERLLQWQATREEADRRWRVIELVVIGLIATLVAGGFTVLGAFIERGSFP